MQSLRAVQTALFAEEQRPPEGKAALQQFFTPRWFAELMVEIAFGRLNAERDVILDPCTGAGSWLHAIPADVRAFGVEIDPELAAIARADTGRDVLVGDFTNIAIDVQPTHIVGNPPFGKNLRAFIRRSHALLPAGGKAGFVLPVHSLSFARSSLALLDGFSCEVSLVPRDLYPRISTPLLFATLTKAGETRLLGLVLYEEAAALRSMRAMYRRILNEGRKPLWREILVMALEALGGEGSLADVYRLVESDFRPNDRRWWRDALRREAGAFAERVRPGYFRLPKPAGIAA